ncbi:Isochorismatase hydrolase [Hymenopellis radicata]|nr:Isochorismatase hydrolase [Hymenopellis radicata]
MATRPPVSETTKYGAEPSFWIEYPSGLIDLSRSNVTALASSIQECPQPSPEQLDIRKSSAIVIIDMQNFFLHPDLRLLPTARGHGLKILWVPPALLDPWIPQAGRGGFGADLPGGFGRLLMRGALNSELYGPLQEEFVKGEKLGTDVWIHKNRMSGLWGYQTALDLYLKENGITTLFFAGVNADQCVLGTFVDAYYRGYDCILLKDATATTSPEGGYANVVYNAGNSYGFVTATDAIV